ncbi:MAG: hypothetical protein IPK24_15350 [Kineosporiaceae bacterium]|nr:hypothetical protein [Kineosporiaceae bacterium]
MLQDLFDGSGHGHHLCITPVLFALDQCMGTRSMTFAFLVPLFATVLTAPSAPALLRVFRSRVSHSMARAARGRNLTGALPAPNPSLIARPDLVLPHGVPPIPRVSPGISLTSGSGLADPLERSRQVRRRIAAAYGAGAAVQAVWTTSVVVLSGGYSAVSIWLIVLGVMALPMVPTLAIVLSARPGTRFGWTIGAVLAVWALASWFSVAEVVGVLIALYAAPPIGIYLLMNARFWRAAAPLVMVVALAMATGWLAGLEVARHLAATGSAVWAWRLIGAAVGASSGLVALGAAVRGYRRGLLSDQMVFIGVWWLLVTVVQVAVLSTVEGAAALLLASGLALGLLVSRLLLNGTGSGQPPVPVRLLLLRVFGHDRRSERLMDELAQRWQPIGTIDLIAGTDLAVRSVEPDEFYAFLTGRLSREFVAGDDEIPWRLAQRSERRGPDGRFRMNQFFCHQDVWQAMLGALVHTCDAVLMDLRDFDSSRQGCLYEVQRLGSFIGRKPIVLLTNDRTDLGVVEWVFAGAQAQLPPQARAMGATLWALDARGHESAIVDSAVALLHGARPA